MKKITLLILASLLLFSIYVQFEIRARTHTMDAHNSGLPKVDEILYKAYPGELPEVIIDEFLTNVTDWIVGPSRRDFYNQVVDAGHKISPMDPMAEFSFMVINCRDYKERSGEPNMPLNDNNFRLALSYIYGMDDKQTNISSYYQVPWFFALGNPVPPAQEPWYDGNITMPYTDFDEAWNILEDAGYYVNTTDNWLYHNGVKIRDMAVWYSTGCVAQKYGPQRCFVRAFNEFITTYLNSTGPTISLDPVDFTTLVMQLMVHRDFDFISIGLTGLGVNVDWLYDMLHSECTDPWEWNFAGIIDPELDEWLWIILTSLNETEIIEAASKVQAKFVYELMPWFPISSNSEFCTTARDERGELMNLISMPNYGPRNDYSWMTLHWKGTPDVAWPGGTLRTALGDMPHTLNPYTEDTLYGWQFLDRAITDLLARDPIELKLMPWVATDWDIAYWASIPELGISEGSTATFYLRQDVTWQDGTPVTAYDCVENMRIMREYHPGRYSSTWANLVYEEAQGPYKFNVYFYTPSLYYATYVAETALLAPKHIIDLVEQQVEDGILETFFDWDPAFNSYKALTGEDPPVKYPFMKQLVGCGPYVFDYYDRSLCTGRVAGYEEFFVSAPVIGSVIGEWRIDPDTTYTYEVLIQNIAAKNNTEEGELINATVGVKIYEDDELTYTETGITLDPWNFTYLGPYTTAALSAGPHTIKVEVYETENLIHTYTHNIAVTIPEDVSTTSGKGVDFVVDLDDVMTAAVAFGSYPKHLKWDPDADIWGPEGEPDWMVDIDDVSKIAISFGWHL